MLHGSMFNHYSKLDRYIEELNRSNSGSSFILQTDPKIVKEIPIYQKIFVSFDGLKDGLLSAYRPVLCIDGNLLKAFLGCCLLFVIDTDGNNQMFLIARVIVEVENNDSWECFL